MDEQKNDETIQKNADETDGNQANEKEENPNASADDAAQKSASTNSDKTTSDEEDDDKQDDDSAQLNGKNDGSSKDDEMQKEPLSTDGLVDPDVDVEGGQVTFSKRKKAHISRNFWSAASNREKFCVVGIVVAIVILLVVLLVILLPKSSVTNDKQESDQQKPKPAPSFTTTPNKVTTAIVNFTIVSTNAVNFTIDSTNARDLTTVSSVYNQTTFSITKETSTNKILSNEVTSPSNDTDFNTTQSSQIANMTWSVTIADNGTLLDVDSTSAINVTTNATSI